MLVSSISSFSVNSNQAVPVTNKNHQNDKHFGQVQNKSVKAVNDRNFVTKLFDYISSAFSPKSKDNYQESKYTVIA